jgi:hypothetical protein
VGTEVLEWGVLEGEASEGGVALPVALGEGAALSERRVTEEAAVEEAKGELGRWGVVRMGGWCCWNCCCCCCCCWYCCCWWGGSITAPWLYCIMGGCRCWEGLEGSEAVGEAEGSPRWPWPWPWPAGAPPRLLVEEAKDSAGCSGS